MKDTMSLKTLCTLLSGKIKCLDVILQFVNPSQLLGPLCQLLDSWRYEDDQGIQLSYNGFITYSHRRIPTSL
jgi:mediator of RNA polymerase II transcription subunit 5